jgi:hypothetical protein
MTWKGSPGLVEEILSDCLFAALVVDGEWDEVYQDP